MKDFFLPLGGGNEIGASSYLFHIAGSNVLVDAGMRFRNTRIFPDFSLLNQLVGGIDSLDAFLLTHAHLDHCGAITRLYHEAPHVPMFAAWPTIELANVMLSDALRVAQKRHSEDWSVVEASKHLLSDALNSFQRISFWEQRQLGSKGTVTAIPAGHILGAASYLIEIAGRRILCTGDFCLHSQRTISGAELAKLTNIDVLVIESTYAYQPEVHTETVDEQYYVLAQSVAETVSQGGQVLIPAFALGRAQEIVSVFRDYFEEGLLEPFDILVDGLVKAICDVYESQRPFLQARLRTRSGRAIYGRFVKPTAPDFYPSSTAIRSLGPACVISSSGMLLDRTRSATYASVLLEDERNAMVFSGYLDEESPGKRLSGLRDGQPLVLRLNGKPVDVRARIKRYYLSAHAHSHDLQSVIRSINPRQVILVHRDERHDGDASFVAFMLQMEREKTRFHLSANGIPIYI